MAKRFKLALKISILILLLAAVGLFAAIPLAVSSDPFRREIERNLSAMLGRIVHLEGVRANLLKGVVARGFAVGPREGFGPEAQMTVRSFEFEAGPLEMIGAIFGRTMRIEKIALDGLNLDLVIRRDGNNFDDLLANLGKFRKPQAEAMEIAIRKIAFEDLTLRYVNEVQGVEEVGVTGRVAGSIENGRIVLAADLAVNGGKVEATVTYETSAAASTSVEAPADNSAKAGRPFLEITARGSGVAMSANGNPAADVVIPFLGRGFADMDVKASGTCSFETHLQAAGSSAQEIRQSFNGGGWIAVDRGELQLGRLFSQDDPAGRMAGAAGRILADVGQLGELLKGIPALERSSPLGEIEAHLEKLSSAVRGRAISFQRYKQTFEVADARVRLIRDGLLQGGDLNVGISGSTGFDRTIDIALCLGGPLIRNGLPPSVARALETGLVRVSGTLDKPECTLEPVVLQKLIRDYVQEKMMQKNIKPRE